MLNLHILLSVLTKKRFIGLGLGLGFALGMATCTLAAERTAQEAWSAFRDFVLRDNEKAILAMTRFPLPVKGDSDDAPSRTCGPDEFNALFAQMLESDSGMSASPLPLRQHIKQHPTLSPHELGANGSGFRVSGMVFEQVRGQWTLTTVYLPNE